jgi:DMSO/TMAO reductase YedYZ molybdopterin-dependent catalytic subunit
MSEGIPPPAAGGPAPPPAPADDEVRRQMRRLTRRSFLVGGAAALAGLSGWGWLKTRQFAGGRVPWPLRRVLEWNERLGMAAFSDARLAPTFPQSQAIDPRVNGMIGLGGVVDPAAWELRVEDDGGRSLRLRLNDVQKLRRTEMVTPLKCIEGWSDLAWWAGLSLRDFATHYRLGTRSGAAPDPERSPGDLYRYVALETPGGGYYVGLDMASALHPQTLLCYEMGGRALTPDHGAPLRLAIPVKYGIKSIKRVGRIRFTDERPADYWAERGYDWYAGH